MKRAIFASAFAAMVLSVSAGTAWAFIGGSGTDSSTMVLPGVCSVTGAPCGPGFGPCPFAGPPTPENCLGFAYSSTFTQNGTSGESSAVQSGPFECKVKTPKGTPASQTVKVNEDSLLVLVNEHHTSTLCACVLLYDGQANLVTSVTTDLSGKDVDEINLCSVLAAVPFAIPLGGLTGHVVVATSAGACPYSGILQGGDYGWVKSVVYSGTKVNAADPFSVTNVRATHATQLRVTPQGVESGSSYAAKCTASLAAPAAAYLENTSP